MSTSPWLIIPDEIEPDKIRYRLFAFHYAGGGSAVFQSWQAALPTDVQLIPICLPGREYRIQEPCLSNAGKIAVILTNELQPWLNKPYMFFGHSIGALLCFETTRKLRQRGCTLPLKLIVSGRNAPQIPHKKPLISEMNDADFLQAVRDFGGMPDELLDNDVLMGMILPRLKADISISETYTYTEEAPLDCDITVLYGEQDLLTGSKGLAPWRAHSNRVIRTICFPGKHFYIHTAEQEVLNQVNVELEDLRSAVTR